MPALSTATFLLISPTLQAEWSIPVGHTCTAPVRSIVATGTATVADAPGDGAMAAFIGSTEIFLRRQSFGDGLIWNASVQHAGDGGSVGGHKSPFCRHDLSIYSSA
ncbi:hypothetical protein K458DRAFT_382539 [Lentithecium fluviatile CBS 122367]|uniref:Uncharacterized protein n=1 Tax=Lentithecium fluviatile CBS 122367 TaxID=1168545 RepID=A0A6G1JLD7_9PLEO|nr:hypothetical protein K458DRAFT_382539 [Lentithecium fluviatile CBS 122367]